jgi:hypothetical protein
MKREMTEFDAVCEDGQKFHIMAAGDYGHTSEDYLVRKDNENSWKVIDIGLFVRPINIKRRCAIP